MSKKYDTLKYYNENAEKYFEQTINADFDINYRKFLKHIKKNSFILDFACGSGRDSKFFIGKGYKVRAIDGSYKMCEIASEYINQKVDCIEFKDFNEENIYDAIWACSVILHIEEENLKDILIKLIKALKNEGIIYFSFKKGKGSEIFEGKLYNYMTKEDLLNILSNIGFNYEIKEYYETISSTDKIRKSVWANLVIKFNKTLEKSV